MTEAVAPSSSVSTAQQALRELIGDSESCVHMLQLVCITLPLCSTGGQGGAIVTGYHCRRVATPVCSRRHGPGCHLASRPAAPWSAGHRQDNVAARSGTGIRCRSALPEPVHTGAPCGPIRFRPASGTCMRRQLGEACSPQHCRLVCRCTPSPLTEWSAASLASRNGSCGTPLRKRRRQQPQANAW